MDTKQLITAAINALEYSYAPYSNFKVAAALLTKDGRIFTGCNIENASFTPTNCAERTAFFKAISEGIYDFEAIAIVGGKDGVLNDYCSPCGVCRQVMMEFCDPKEFQIVLEDGNGGCFAKTLEEILPFGFGPANLREEE